MSFNIMTYNCRGLGGIEKRRDVLNYLKKKEEMLCIFFTRYSFYS